MTWEELEKEHEEVNSMCCFLMNYDGPMLPYCYFVVVDPSFDDDCCEL